MKKINFIIPVFLLFILSCKHESLPKKAIEDMAATDLQKSVCVAQEILDREIAADPQRAVYIATLEQKINDYLKTDNQNARVPGKLYLPVVIHIVHVDTNIISNAQIISQVQVWNKDFNKQNVELANTSVYLAGYSYNNVANCQIEFYVTDIKRVATTVVEFPLNNTVKSSANGGSDPIDPATKLNVWVCNTPNGSSWGQGPGVNPLVDGVIIDYAFFGSNNPNFIGRIGTHEVGHWLNLWHIWGNTQCGDDLVNDTPLHFGPSSGCPAQGTRSACKRNPLLMWMNYMDYSMGTCQYMFTDGQKKRMDATIGNGRPAYFSTTKIYTDILNVVW